MVDSLSRYWRAMVLMLAVAVLLPGCAAPLVPEARVSRAERLREPDAALLAQLREDWRALQTANPEQVEYLSLVNRYNQGLLKLLRRYRADMKLAFERGERDYVVPGVVFEPAGGDTHLPLREVYEDIVPAVDVTTSELQEHYEVPGLGVPMVGIVPAENVEKIGRRVSFRTRGTVSTLTAIMEFPFKHGKPVLRLLSRDMHESILLRGRKHRLAADSGKGCCIKERCHI